MKAQTFLGGSCNPTNWRMAIAIPLLEAAGVEFYNPQQDNWTPEMATTEAAAKAESEELLFVIDSQTRAIASILEATEYIASGRNVTLVILDMPDGTVIEDKSGNQTVTGRELKDLNRARAYLRELATRHTDNATVFPDVESATKHIISMLNS